MTRNRNGRGLCALPALGYVTQLVLPTPTLPRHFRALLVLSVGAALVTFGRQPVGRAETTAPVEQQVSLAASPVSSVEPARVYADAFALWIYAKPRKSRVPIGYLRGGQSVVLREPKAVSFEGCKRGWYAVEPAGYVCLDQAGSLTSTRYNQAMQTLAPAPGPFPFLYGVSLGTSAFRRVPRAEELGAVQGAPISPSEVVLNELLTTTQPAASAMPWFLADGGSVGRVFENRLVRRQVPARTLLSLVGRFDVENRAYYQVADGTVVPAERVHLLRPSSFEGVWLTPGQKLPLAWTRERVKTQRLSAACAAKLEPDFSKVTAGQLGEPLQVLARCFEPGAKELAASAAIFLSGRRVIVAGTTLLETQSGDWINEASVRVALLETPKHALGQKSDKWIHFSIQRGTLVAYDGETPVFATLASPGSGEPNARGARRLTPKGTFRINFKHITDDMSSEDGEHRSEWKADVPYAMYFNQPYGIHVAYWHEKFGEPKSGGCINVSPVDGAALFDWTEPKLPSGWYGVGSSPELGLGTVVHVTD